MLLIPSTVQHVNASSAVMPLFCRCCYGVSFTRSGYESYRNYINDIIDYASFPGLGALFNSREAVKTAVWIPSAPQRELVHEVLMKPS